MAAFACRNPVGTGFPFLPRAGLVIVSLLLAAWIVWVTFFAALIVLPVIAVAALAARLLRRHTLPRRATRFDGVVIEAEYHVIPPER